MGVPFTQAHDKDSNEKINTNRKVNSHYNITGQNNALNWKMNCVDSSMPTLSMRKNKYMEMG